MRNVLMDVQVEAALRTILYGTGVSGCVCCAAMRTDDAIWEMRAAGPRVRR